MRRARLDAIFERLFLPVMVVGFVCVFALATYLSMFAARDIANEFSYQEAVVASQRDAGLLKYQLLDPRASMRARGLFARRLADDLARVGALAATPDERPPPMLFDTARPDFTELELRLATLQTSGCVLFRENSARNVRIRIAANVGFGLLALLFVIGQAQLRERLAIGRKLVEGLQRAFLARRRTLPNVRTGSVLLSSAAGSSVGGDVHDVFTFDGRYGMFLIADVSGKGLDAAVDTVFIKYAIRTLFSDERDPGIVLARFASLYARAAENPESFVVMFLGVIDTETGDVRYASAGHEPAFVKRGGAVTILEPTGPLVGVFAAARYETRALTLGSGDVIALSTDGLTESRDGRGALLGASAVAEWLAECDADGSHMAERIVKRLRARSRHIADDLAILTLEYAPGRTATVEEPAREAVSGATLVTTA